MPYNEPTVSGTMSERGTNGRHSRVSPSPGRGSKVAYTPCPRNDPQEIEMEMAGNCLAIPLSSIQTGNTKGGGKTSTGGGKLLGKAQRTNPKRSRETGMGMSNNEDFHYRTHLFFSPNRSTGFHSGEERCSALSSSGGGISSPPMSYDVDLPQPLVDRRSSSMSLLKWTINNRSDIPTPTAARQVSFGGGTARTEPLSLSTLDRDCFIIPIQSLDRFLPAGVPLPSPTADGAKPTSPLSVLEVSDPKQCILVHLMSPLEPVDPVIESPLAHPLLKQRAVAAELLNEVQQANTAVGGMLLANMEKTAEFPFIAYYMINTTQTDPSNFYSGIRVSSLSKFEPKSLKYTAAHTLDLYSEVAAICRPPLAIAPTELGHLKKSQTPSTGFIISVFKVFEGDDGERFEKNWLYWTGARMLYRYLPRAAGLRRIALHKSVSQKGDKMYLLVCECSDLLKDISSAAVLIPALRARLCGYIGLYRPIQAF